MLNYSTKLGGALASGIRESAVSARDFSVCVCAVRVCVCAKRIYRPPIVFFVCGVGVRIIFARMCADLWSNSYRILCFIGSTEKDSKVGHRICRHVYYLEIGTFDKDNV